MRRSPKAEQIIKSLPEDMQKVLKDVSFDYQFLWKCISDHLKTIYGEYGDAQFCLNEYYESEEYKKNRHEIRRCPDIPLINMDDIHNMLLEEDDYSNTVHELLDTYKKMDDSATIHNIASMLGIYPDYNARALYKHIVAKKAIPEERWFEIVNNSITNQSLFKVISNILSKNFEMGYLLEFPAAGCVMTQTRGRYYYRGENAYYRSSKASCFRVYDTSKPEFIQILIDRLRLYQCWEMLDCFDAIKNWNFCEINYMALAQHYGFRTQMLDITSDLKTQCH